MLRKILFVSLAVITLASCKKDKDDAPAANHVSAKVDGVQKDFNTAVAAQKDGDAQSGYTIVIIAVGGTASSPLPAFNLSIADDAAITAKAYTGALSTAGGTYVDASQTSFESDTDFTITVSSVTATEIKGSFSGKVDDGAGHIANITEGSFSAKF